MFNHTVIQYESDDQKDRLVKGLNCVCAFLPYLAGLAVLLKIYVTDVVDTAGITPTGRLLINPGFLESLKLQELAFILAHELMHLVLKTNERAGRYQNPQLVNIAHDFIINDEVSRAFRDDTGEGRGLIRTGNHFWQGEHISRPPAGGLHWLDYESRISKWKPADEYSLEEMVGVLRKEGIFPEKSWAKSISQNSSSSSSSLSGGGGCGGGSLGDLLRSQLSSCNFGVPAQTDLKPQPFPKLSGNHKLDVLTKEDEQMLFPELTEEEVKRCRKEIREAAIRSYSEAELTKSLKNYEYTLTRDGAGTGSGGDESMIGLLRGSYITPWEAALQRWFDSVAPGTRTYARPSRRGAWRTDVVLPGRKREGWTLHIVLDTSGSMSDSLRKALGAIDQFCQNNNVETVHILQCDTDITSDEWVEVGDLENFQAKGFGGSDMSPAMLHLAEDPEVTAVLVLTDGYIDYPEEEPPYETLWGIVDSGHDCFSYGTAIRIETNKD